MSCTSGQFWFQVFLFFVYLRCCDFTPAQSRSVFFIYVLACMSLSSFEDSALCYPVLSYCRLPRILLFALYELFRRGTVDVEPNVIDTTATATCSAQACNLVPLWVLSCHQVDIWSVVQVTLCNFGQQMVTVLTSHLFGTNSYATVASSTRMSSMHDMS